jgi:hypothetical protein
MRRAVLGLILAGVCGACVPPPPPPPPVYVYGDSLTGQARPYIKAGATVRAVKGYAPCDWLTQMRSDATRKPETVVLAFVGNYPTSCTAASSRYDSYTRDFGWIARHVFGTTTKVYLVVPTATCSGSGNADVAQAVTDSALPTLDARSQFTCSDLSSDGIHLGTQNAKQRYAAIIGGAW